MFVYVPDTLFPISAKWLSVVPCVRQDHSHSAAVFFCSSLQRTHSSAASLFSSFDGLELDKSFVERSKESLDPVAPDLVVADVIQIFS